MQSLEIFRSKAAGLPDLINYAVLVDEGVVQGKDGSLIAGYFFRGADAGSASNAEQDDLTAKINTVLARFGSEWCMWVDAARLPSPDYPAASRSRFPDPVSAMIEAERREMFEREGAHFETEYALILQYLPPSHRAAKIGEMIYDDESYDGTSPGNKILTDFKKKLGDFENGINRLLNPHRMGSFTAGSPECRYESDELVNYLRFTLTGETQALRVPDCPMYLDAWLGYKSFWPGDTPKIGDTFISCIQIDGFPSLSKPGVLSMLGNLPISYRWSSRFIFLEEHQAVAELVKYRNAWSQSVKSIWSQMTRSNSGPVNKDSLSMAAQVDQAIADVRSGLVVYGYYTTVIVLMGEDLPLLKKQALYVKQTVDGMGFAARVEDVNAQEAWLGTLPGHPYPNVRRPLMHTLQLAEMLPLSGIWPGLSENPCSFYPESSPPLMHAITTGSTPFRINLHVGQVGHTLIFGPTGAGKSLLVALIAAQFRRYYGRALADGSFVPATVMAIDKGRSLYTLCKAVGGDHYDIGADVEVGESGLSLCPLEDIDSESGLAWACEWLNTCYELQTSRMFTPDHKNEVRRALKRTRGKPRGARSLHDFITTVQSTEIRSALSHYSSGGGVGGLLDGEGDALKASDFTVFEIDELMSMGEKNFVPVLLYLFRRFVKSLTGQPALLIVEEGWIALGTKTYRDQLREFFKELRKKNCAIVFATQSLSDAVRSGIFDTLLEQCPTKILLPNIEADLHGTADNPGPAEYYAMFGLNEREIQHLKSGIYQQDYYFRSPQGKRMFQLGVGPLAMSFIGISDKDKIREVKGFEAKYGEDWPLYWMKSRGVNYEKYT